MFKRTVRGTAPGVSVVHSYLPGVGVTVIKKAVPPG
jgi:hypothetical protein